MVKTANIRCITGDSASYPPLLREIFDPPARLYIRGVLPDPEKPAVAVVGTRRPGAAAMRDALRLGRELAERGITVVSGLALGIDALAHRGCLDAGGVTVAVLGSGVDQVYPASNRDLARRIIDNGGALVSEYECGTKPLKWHFPARNRIISGWARGVVIVEAPERSGALHTARFALEQGRDVWVASAGAASSRGGGTKALVDDGCAVINGAADILAEWRMLPADRERDGARNPAGNAGAALAESLRKELAF